MTTPKELALTWLTAMVTGDAAVGELMTPDFRHFAPGTMPGSGWKDRQTFLAGLQALGGVLAGPLTLRIGDVTAEDDRVWIEAESEAPLPSGAVYANTYVFAIRVRDGKIAELKEFFDTLHVYEALDIPFARGPRQARQSPLASILTTVQGPAVAHR